MATTKGKGKESQGATVIRVLRETRSELRKVVWPTRQETIRLTIVVIVISLVIGLYLFAGDILFGWLYSLLLSLIQ
jgi:preprotein translocase subunit SecE